MERNTIDWRTIIMGLLGIYGDAIIYAGLLVIGGVAAYFVSLQWG
jgi:hypothetical protein